MAHDRKGKGRAKAAIPPKLEKTAELPLGDTKGAAKRIETPMQAHDRGLIARSITDRIAELEALAKKNRGEGYQKEAIAIERDAEILKTNHLPTFTDGTLALPFPAESEAKGFLKKHIKQVQTELARQIAARPGWMPSLEQTRIIAQATNTLVESMIAVLIKCTNDARAQGQIDRQVDAAVVVEKALRKAFETMPA